MTTLVQELSLAERAELHRLESVIHRGWRTFIQVGEALGQIHEKRLYREEYPTFDAYCQGVWKWSRQRAYQMMDAAKTARVMEDMGVTVTTERQARDLKPVVQAIALAPAEDKSQVMQELMAKPLRQPARLAAPPRPAASRPLVTLYLHSAGEGKWRGTYYIDTARYCLTDALTLGDIETQIGERLSGDLAVMAEEDA